MRNIDLMAKIKVIKEAIEMHIMRAFISKETVIKKFSSDWLRNPVILPQGYAMLFLTDKFFDDIEELGNVKDSFHCELEYVTPAVASLMEYYSFKSKLAYIETEYFGGMGGQGGVLYMDGKVVIAPRRENDSVGLINHILSELGVARRGDDDEFDSIHLYKYRTMKGFE